MRRAQGCDHGGSSQVPAQAYSTQCAPWSKIKIQTRCMASGAGRQDVINFPGLDGNFIRNLRTAA